MTAWARLLVVCGPSGVGKGTVVAELLARRPDIWLSISTTTRSPRPGEVDGVAYHFVSRAEFERTVAQGGFMEWAEYAGNLYGTAVAPVAARLDAGDVVVLEIDLEGARQVRRSHPDALFVFLAPPSLDELRRRLSQRGTESAEVVAQRLDRAEHELAAQDEFDHVVTNAEVSATADVLLQLVGVEPSDGSPTGR